MATIRLFLKAIEALSIEPQNETEIPQKAINSMNAMLKYGQTVAKEYSKSYLLKRKIADAHEGGSIYIHDLEYLPMGTTNCLHIDLNKLFKDGFSTGIGYLREPNNIMTYSILASIASPFAYLLVPVVGVVSWQLAAAAVTGFIAKENVVGT